MSYYYIMIVFSSKTMADDSQLFSLAVSYLSMLSNQYLYFSQVHFAFSPFLRQNP